MSFDQDFESTERRALHGNASADEAASPEDLLFAVPEEEGSGIRNPYDDDIGFDDGMSAGGLGPQSVGDSGAAFSEARGAGDGHGGSELANLFLDDGESDFPESSAQAAADMIAEVEIEAGSMPGLVGNDFYASEEPAPPPHDVASPGASAAFGVPSVVGADDLGGGAGDAASSRARPADEPSKIPGRNRVSYSQGKRDYRPASDPLHVAVGASAGSASIVWVLPFAAFLGGACFAAYYFLRVGSPVLAGVSFTVGAIAALFCRVLFRR